MDQGDGGGLCKTTTNTNTKIASTYLSLFVVVIRMVDHLQCKLMKIIFLKRIKIMYWV